MNAVKYIRKFFSLDRGMLLLVMDFYLTGAEEMRKFTVVGKFAKGKDNAEHEGSNDE